MENGIAQRKHSIESDINCWSYNILSQKESFSFLDALFGV